MSLQIQLRRIVERDETLARDEAAALLETILRGETTEIALAGLLVALATRGETSAEIAGFADTMRQVATVVPLQAEEREALVDTCGTGGDASGTFNISTAAALVAAAAGATVAKHGNRAVTSACGSGDVLEALGIPVGLSPVKGAEALRQDRFAFFHAPSLHPAMKAVMPVRRGLGIRTIFNVVGPLANPAGARAQVMGVYAARLVPLVAEAMVLLGVRHAFVVHGSAGQGGQNASGIDEFSISGASEIAEVRGGNIALRTVTPEQFGLARAPLETLRGGDAVANAAILRAIFAGERGPRRDVVTLNAAAVLVAAGKAENLTQGLQLAGVTIDKGVVAALVGSLAGARRA